MEFSDGLAVAAIALALSTIFLGVLFYRWQTEQGREITKTINEFAKEMHGVLGEIKGLTTSTRSSLDRTVDQLLSAVVGRSAAVPSAPAAVAEQEQAGRHLERWRVEQAVRVFKTLRAAPRVLEYLAGGARDTDDLATQLVGLRPEGEHDDPWMWDIAAIIAVSNAFDLLALDREKSVVTLTARGRQIAARLSEGTDD